MVKGISRQVIVVHAPDPQLFEQAIFILKDNAATQQGITDSALLKEAQQLLHEQGNGSKRVTFVQRAFWACLGAAMIGLIWLMTVLF